MTRRVKSDVGASRDVSREQVARVYLFAPLPTSEWGQRVIFQQQQRWRCGGGALFAPAQVAAPGTPCPLDTSPSAHAARTFTGHPHAGRR